MVWHFHFCILILLYMALYTQILRENNKILRMVIYFVMRCNYSKPVSWLYDVLLYQIMVAGCFILKLLLRVILWQDMISYGLISTLLQTVAAIT